MLIFYEEFNFQVLSVLRAKHRGGFFNVAPRPYAALSLRLGGSGKFKIGDTYLTSSPGDILYLPQDTPYEVEYTDNEMIVVHLQGSNCKTPEIITPKSFALAESYFSRMLNEWEKRHSVNFVKSMIYRLLDSLATELTGETDSDTFTRSLKYLDDNFENPDVNIDTLCKNTYVCRSTLQREFLRHLGTTPIQYLTKTRMEKALSLLATEHQPISVVSSLSGFSDVKYFSRVFKKIYGFSPSEARENMHL